MGLLHDIRHDFRAVFRMDPAARSGLEVILSYAGFHAIVLHRINHLLWNWHVPVVPRFLSQVARFLTGIEIHPAAKIGKGFFIDHGMGVVIGETSEIGENVLLYQGVTLGGTGKQKGKRHPTLGSNVVVGAGTKILGAITIGDNVKIGANSVVLHSVPENSIVVGVPGRVIKKKVLKIFNEGLVEMLDHVHLPDPIEEKFEEMKNYISELERRISTLEGKGETIRVYNTMSGRKEDFSPQSQGQVKMYVCGITAYDVCHLGHARSAIVFDIVKRYLRYKGFQVTHVRNITDIDDKIIARAQKDNVSYDVIAKKYTDEYYRDMEMLGVSSADIEPNATDHIREMIQTIQGLIDKGFAYPVDGDVYFEVGKFAAYGKLSKKNTEDLMSGARVDVDERKRSPLDFALWKSSKEGEPWWESPWGKGRPGWHIECTAMSSKYLSETFDIHGGGADLIFPHHENEIAQSEAYTGKPFVKYWMHNGFITVDKEKMSKSLGNFFTIKEILEKYDPETVRYFLLTAHYRSPIEFSDVQLTEAELSIDRYYSTVTRIKDFLEAAGAAEKPGTSADLEKVLAAFKDKFHNAMNDDFNTASALGFIFELIREVNRFLDSKPSGQKAKELVVRTRELLAGIGGILNIFNRTPEEWYRSLMKVKKIAVSEEALLQKIAERQEARKQKDWARADNVRKELEDKGIILEDKKEGTAWKVKAG
ncbi:MAG: cysteine--tRNA ligase [Nitrospiraceae bacterium]|nr:MAG: cysteine--tRNA ligase [Nitrospiraceae bacterium]